MADVVESLIGAMINPKIYKNMDIKTAKEFSFRAAIEFQHKI